MFCAATSVTAQTVSQVRNQSTNPTYTPSGAVTSPPLCYNRTTHHLWGYAGGYWYDLTSTPYIDLDPSPTNEKIVSFSVVAGVLRINENGIFYNVPINDIIGAANISSSSPTITVTNVAGVVTVSSTDPDEDATNECNNGFFVTVDSLKISDNCGTLAVPLAALGAPTLANNGLSMVGDTVQLGGTLQKNTTVAQNGYEMVFANTYPSGDVSQIYQGDSFLGALPAVGQSYVTPVGTNSYVLSGANNNIVAVQNGNTITKIQQTNDGTTPPHTEITSQLGLSTSTSILYPDSLIVAIYAGTSNTFAVYENSIKSTAYPQTRDDSGTTTPTNFLYTDANGVVQSAPTALITPDLCTQIQALPTGTPTPTDKIVYFGGGCFLGDAPAGGVQDTSFWRLTGNAGTDGGSTNFVGTTDAQDFVVKTNSIEIARFGQQGNAAFGSDLTSIAPSLVAPTANNIGSMAFQSGQATGAFSTAFQVSTASGDASVAFGEGNTASGYLSATFGRNNVVNGYYSVVFGENNIVSGLHSAAFGLNNTASGGNSFTFGENNIASGNYSTAFGRGNTSPSDNETTLGLLSTNYTVANNNSDRLFTIGNGTSDILRNNALTLWKDGRSMWNGDIAKQNTWIGVNGTNPQNFINITTPTGSLAAISTEHTTSGNYAVLGSNAGSSGLVINDTKQFAFTTTAGTTSTQLGSTSTIANYSASGVNIGGNSAATSTLDVTGSFSLPVLIVNATATITSNHCSIECNNGATNITLTLPDPTTCRGRIYMVHRNAGSTGTVTINPGGGLIQELAGTLGATTSISALGSYGQHVWFQSDGTNWLRVN